MTLDGKTVFLAGATGLAGSSLIQHIIENYPSARIKAAYHSTTPFIKNQRIDYVQADLTKKDDCLKAVSGCDFAILAAANTGGAASARSEPHRQVTDNLVMDALLLESLSFENVKRTVFISSATVYQEFNGFIKEDALDLNLDPHPAYLGVGWAKRSAELLCRFWHEKYGMEIAIVRSSNIFGPWAKFDPKQSNFIPGLIRKAVDRMVPYEVWGSLDVARDVIYSADFAEAVVTLLARKDIKFGIFNLGSGKTTTVSEVVDWALKYAGHTPENIICSDEKPTTIRFRGLDCSKIGTTIGWAPKFTIEEGVRITTEWWIENKTWWKK